MLNRMTIQGARKEFRDNTLELEKGLSPNKMKGHGLLPETILRAKTAFGAARLKLVVKCATLEDMRSLKGDKNLETAENISL